MQRVIIPETQADLVERSDEVTQWSPEREEVEGDDSHWTIEARAEQFGKLGQVFKPSTVSKKDVNSRTVSVADILLWGKEMCWQYFKSQQLYIEAMQEVKNDPEFDPRRSDHTTGKYGRFVKKKNATSTPKNPMTIQYLCYAFDVPYATFKRCKADAFVTKKYVPPHKGKSVVTDTKWASQVFTERRMYVLHGMESWIRKHPSKNDSHGKKV
jgi:hypothetical protein